jgi:group I intron endonuclease
MNIYSIYKATNKINGKVYIGFDSNWPHRKNCHKSYHKRNNQKESKNKFYRALRKYGWENFQWLVIYQSKDKEYTKNIMENYFINEYDSFKNGYNSTLGGDGTFGSSRKGIKFKYNHSKWLGKKHTEETKKLMSKNMKGVKKPNANQKGGNNNNAKKIKTPFGIFDSIRDASLQIQGYTYIMIWKRLQYSKDWIYL